MKVFLVTIFLFTGCKDTIDTVKALVFREPTPVDLTVVCKDIMEAESLKAGTLLTSCQTERDEAITKVMSLTKPRGRHSK